MGILFQISMATTNSRRSSRTPKPNQKYSSYIKVKVNRSEDADSEGESSTEEGVGETEHSPNSSPVKTDSGK